MPDVLEVSRLNAAIAGRRVLHDVSCAVPDSGVTAVVGDGRAGKTALLKAILGLIERTGEIRLDGRRIDRAPTHKIFKAGVGYVPDETHLLLDQSVQRNVETAVRGRRPQWDLVRSLFPEVLVERASAPAGTLSGGQQQMVSLARALVNQNRLLLIDSPTRGLSARRVAELATVLKVVSRSTPILLVERDSRFVGEVADRVVMLEEGRVRPPRPGGGWRGPRAR